MLDMCFAQINLLICFTQFVFQFFILLFHDTNVSFLSVSSLFCCTLFSFLVCLNEDSGATQHPSVKYLIREFFDSSSLLIFQKTYFCSQFSFQKIWNYLNSKSGSMMLDCQDNARIPEDWNQGNPQYHLSLHNDGRPNLINLIITSVSQIKYIRPLQCIALSSLILNYKQQMYETSSVFDNKCKDCGLIFDTQNQLLNHKRKFCINSGYDNLEGLARIQFHGVKQIQPNQSQRNYLQQYGANTLANVGNNRVLTASEVELDMKSINQFKRQLEGVKKYKHQPEQQSQIAMSSVTQVNNKKQNLWNSYSQSRLDGELKQYQKLPEEAISPPTYLDQLNRKNNTVLDKSNSSMGRMAAKDRFEYAKYKLDELNEIKQSYIKNGGNKRQFKDNLDKMIAFYQNLLSSTENCKENQTVVDTQQLIQSRCSTPILKLRDLRAESKKSNRLDQSNINKLNESKLRSNDNQNSKIQNTAFQQYNQPQIVYLPYPPPNQQNSSSNDGFRVLQKMMELKSQENQKLLQILLEQRRKDNQILQNRNYHQMIIPPQNTQVDMNKSQSRRIKSKDASIDVNEEYQFKKSMIGDLISEEKVLLALQQEQLDEMKLLSQLPKQLQEIKLKSVIKASQIRFQMEKQILQQKLQRINYQTQNQKFEEQRKLTNDRWAGDERKKMVEFQMNQHVNNFKNQFTQDDQQ